MRKRSRFFSPNMILGMILVIFVFVDVILFFVTDAVVQEKIEIEDKIWRELYIEDEIEGEMEDNIDYCDASEDKMEAIIKIEDVTTKCLGNTYEGREADSGYLYHSVLVTIKNIGARCAEIDDLPIKCISREEHYVSDVSYIAEEKRKNNLYSEKSIFYYVDIQIIPPGETYQKEFVFEVKDGTEDIYLYVDSTEDIFGVELIKVHLE